MGLYLC